MSKKIITPKNKTIYVKIPPNPKRLIHALREMGYTSFDALLDLVDNCIDAKATRVAVTIKGLEKDMVIDILDNGVGMDRETLNQALRFGSETEHKDIDLGKYGMGLNSAGVSLARNIWVLTRQEKKQAYEAVFDLDHIDRSNEWEITLHEATGHKVFEHLGDRGTLVRLSRIDRPGDTNIPRFADNLRKRMGMVYRHFIEAGIVFSVNNRIVQAVDPLMLEHELTEVVYDKDIDLAGHKAHLTAVELPEFGQTGDADAGIFPHTSGVYIVRNQRQIMDAQTFGFYRHHHSYSHFRAELSFDGTLDDAFHVDVKKGMIWPDSRLVEKLRQVLQPLIVESGKRGRDRETKPVAINHTSAEERIAAVLQSTAAVKPDATPAAKPKAKQESAPAPASPPPKPVEFIQVKDASPRFYKAQRQPDSRLEVALNSAHPFVSHVARQPGGMAILDVIAFALASVEETLNGEGDKFITNVSAVLSDLFRK